MPKSRLKLDFTLSTTEERKNFIDRYTKELTFTPNAEELEMMGNYILWGKDADVYSAVQRKEIQISTRHNTWQKKGEESLDALLESPTFNETNLFEVPKTKPNRAVFSRKETQTEAPKHMQKIFQELFAQIDTIDLVINYYDLLHGKRKNPPRDELLEKFSEEEQHILEDRAAHLNQFKYLKLRHELVELRRQQFTLRDSYRPMIQRTTPQLPITNEKNTIFEFNCEVLPLGVQMEDGILCKLFLNEENLHPAAFNEQELRQISDFYWEKKDILDRLDTFKELYVNFLDETHIAAILQMYFELEDSYNEEDLDLMTRRLLCTLQYYIKLARLTDVQREILDLKIKKKTNNEIQKYINKKYQKSYTINYISTIFRQKIIPSICEAVEYHQEIIGNLFFEENFKKCSMCGKELLLSKYNFIKKSRSKDGYSNRCKICEKEERKRKKENN